MCSRRQILERKILHWSHLDRKNHIHVRVKGQVQRTPLIVPKSDEIGMFASVFS